MPNHRLVALATLLVLIGFVPQRVAHAAPPDLTGTWTLDLEASDPVDSLLAVQGLSLPERSLASRMAVTQTIVQAPGQIRIQVDSVARSRSELLHLDGREETVQSESAGPVRTRTQWAPDGVTLVTRSDVRLADGRPATLVVSRRLADGGRTLLQRLDLAVASGERLAATRVFRKS